MYKHFISLILSLTIFPSLYVAHAQSLNPIIEEHLVETYDLSPSQVAQLRITDHYTSDHNGIEHFYFDQYIGGIEVYNAKLAVHLHKGEVILVNNSLWNSESTKINGFALSALDAVESSAGYLGYSSPDIRRITEESLNRKESLEAFLAPEISNDTVEPRKLYLPVGNELHPVWSVGFYLKDHSHYWDLFVDANSGEIIDAMDRVITCEWDSPTEGNSIRVTNHNAPYENMTPDFKEAQSINKTSGTNEYLVYAIPVESPAHGDRSIVTSAADSIASPYGWHDTDGIPGADFTITRGNNVLAQEDRNGDNDSGYSVDGGSSLSFITDFDTSKNSLDYIDAAIVNLFYMNNVMHDVWYQYGFNEVSGNFQSNNYGKGGIAGDDVIAEAQDASGFNNANFYSGKDGVRARMQMFLWSNGLGAEFIVNSPASIAGSYQVFNSSFGPLFPINPITSDLVVVVDDTDDSTDGCDSIINVSAVSGKVALVNRGTCSFVSKVKNIQDAGALAVVVVNNVSGKAFTMSGFDDQIVIPSLMISMDDGALIRSEIEKGGIVNVTMFDSTQIRRYYDCDFDNGIIGHEFGHGISIRLTGGPSSSGCLSNAEQMGEGWSDFFGLVMTHQPGDSARMARGVGAYVKGSGQGGTGLRPYSYSTDTSINPTTYADVADLFFTQPHGIGSIWCEMLWEVYWALIERYGYDPDLYHGKGGNNIAMQLVVDGLKLQKCSPGFVDGRDAILLADRINNEGRNQRLIWMAFAKRGLGYSAEQGSSSSRTDGVEAFDVPEHLFNVEVVKKAPQTIIGGEEMKYSFEIVNKGDSVARNIVVTDTLDDRLSPATPKGICDWTFEGKIATLIIDSLRPHEAFTCELAVQVANAGTSVIAQADGAESSPGRWVPGSVIGSGGFTRTASRKFAGDSSWFCSNPESKSDRYLTNTILLEGSAPAVSFYHLYNTEEGWDGAVVEIDTGSGWMDLGPYFIFNGYNDKMRVNATSNISGRTAFTGNSDSFMYSVIDLLPFAGREVSLRFRMVSDAATKAEGWYIDNIYVYNSLEILRNDVYIDMDNYPSGNAGTFSVFLGSDPVSVSDITNEPTLIKVYPNPASTLLTIEHELNGFFTISLVDINGHVVSQVCDADKNKVELDIRSLRSGIYFLKLISAEQTQILKIFVR